MVQSKSVRRGRPRSFDTDRVLERAMRVFWEKGYEGASLTDLTEAMGINRPSLYAAFGDKKALFRKVLDRYGQGPAAFLKAALLEPTAREAIEKLLRGSVEVLTNPKNPKGCLLIQGGLACGEEAESVRCELESRRAEGEAEVVRRLKRAKAEGELTGDVNPTDLAHFFVAVMRGLGVQASSGASREELMKVVDVALRAWPK